MAKSGLGLLREIDPLALDASPKPLDEGIIQRPAFAVQADARRVSLDTSPVMALLVRSQAAPARSVSPAASTLQAEGGIYTVVDSCQEQYLAAVSVDRGHLAGKAPADTEVGDVS